MQLLRLNKENQKLVYKNTVRVFFSYLCLQNEEKATISLNNDFDQKYIPRHQNSKIGVIIYDLHVEHSDYGHQLIFEDFFFYIIHKISNFKNRLTSRAIPRTSRSLSSKSTKI